MKIHITAVKFSGFGTPTITVVLDGQEAAWLGDGQSAEIDAAPGKHDMLFTSMLRKTSVQFEGAQDVSISLKWNRLTGKLQALVTGSNVKTL